MGTLAETLWREFAVETEEHLQALEPILAQADPQSAGATDIAQLFRSFHSIKGLARAMDVLGMEAVAHHAENLLSLVRDGRAPLTAELADLLLQSVDALKRMRNAIAQQRADVPPDGDLVARLAAAFAAAGGAAETQASAAVASGGAAALSEDPELLAIFVEMVKARGPELCGALTADSADRETALDAAETLMHAAEVMNLDALAASFGGLHEILRSLAAGEVPDGPTRQELMGRLGDIRLQIELVGEITGKDAGAATFSAELARRVGDDRRRLVLTLGELNRHLRDHLGDADRLAAEADAAAVARLARMLHATAAVLSLPRTAEIALLIEDIYGRAAGGRLDAAASLLDAVDDVSARLAVDARAGTPKDLAADEAARLNARLRAPLISAAETIATSEGAGRLVAGLYIAPQLLAVLSDENLATLERGVERDELRAYEVLMHLEANPEIAERLMAWLTEEAQPITNRTAITGGESWFEFLVLSPLDSGAFAAALLEIDPGRRCIKGARRLTETPDGTIVLDPGAAAPPAAETALSSSPLTTGNLLRVRGEAVDAFLDDIGELRVSVERLSHQIRGVGSRAMLAAARAFVEKLPRDLRAEFSASFRDFRERDRRLLEIEEQISGLLGRLHQSALELRVVPVDVVFNRLPRLVRDLATRQGKAVDLVLEGRDVRIDKGMVDALTDPLIHMVRNAVDHGIEPPAERRHAGKPERARLTLRAATRGSEIRIEISDDGRGLDADAIRAKATARGRVSATAAAALPDSEVFQFIFEAGLSTAAAITETSGRGVGMDIVLATVRRLNGDITIRSEPGRGTAFTLILPVSAALQTALIVRVGEQSLAIPERHVMSVAEIERSAIQRVGSHRSILHREAVLPLFGLGNLLGMPNGAGSGGRAVDPVVVATNGRQMIGLEVDAIEQRIELFLKDLDPRLARFPGVGGAAMLGDGRVVLVLDGEELIQLAARGIDHGGANADRLVS